MTGWTLWLVFAVAVGPAEDPAQPRPAPGTEPQDPAQPRPAPGTEPEDPAQPRPAPGTEPEDPAQPRPAPGTEPEDPAQPRPAPGTEPEDPAQPRPAPGTESEDPAQPRPAPGSTPEQQPVDPSAPRPAGPAAEPSAPSPLDPSAPRPAAPGAAPPTTVDPSQPRAAAATTQDCPDPAAAATGARADADRRKQKIADSPFRRRGPVVGLAAGVSGCSSGRDWCGGENYFALGVPTLTGAVTGVFAKESKVGPSFILEGGYRPLRMLETTAFLEFTYRPQQINVPQGTSVGETLAFNLAGGVAAYLYPLRYSRFDPFVGLGIGAVWHKTAVAFTSSEQIERTFDERMTRALIRLSAGVNIFVVERLSLGPRVDYDLLAGGRLCTEITRTDPGAPTISSSECEAASQLNDLPTVDGAKGPAGQLPQFWRVSLGARTYF